MSLTNYLHILLICMLPYFGLSQNTYLDESPIPEWVESPELQKEESGLEKKARGYFYLLLDNQVNTQTEETFHRRAFKILSAQGIQDMSDFSIDFDPEYHRVKIHSLDLIRDGQVIDKLNLNTIQIIQREMNLERHLYDGRLSAVFNISDVRVNDILDISYTVEGFNPIHKGYFQNTFFLSFTDPVARNHISILVPKDSKLNYKVFNGQQKPKIETQARLKKYTFDLKEPEIVKYQDNTPYWYISNAYVQFSQYDSWEQVSSNFSDYYKVSPKTREWLKDRSAEIFKGETDSITEIIRFVQDDIRYLGFENGLNSHKPSEPREVFERRFGDCKDKALLLSELLRLQGVEANPVLVSSTNSETLKDNLPSPNAFDHCIVQIHQEDKISYIDPTINFQGGNLGSVFFPDYAYGLPLDARNSNLIQFPDPEPEAVQIFETIEIEELGTSATLNVTTSYRDEKADIIRRDFSQNNRTAIQENYTNFYSTLYPSVRALGDIIYDDYRNIENKIIVTEEYIIEDFWQKDPENENTLYGHFYPLSLDAHLFPGENPNRKDPYYIDPGLNVEHHIAVLLPEAWNMLPDAAKIENDFFNYTFELKPRGNRFDITHSFRNLSDHIPAERYGEYLAEVKKVHQHMNYYINYDSNFVGNASKAGDLSWISIILFLISIGTATYFAIKVYKNYDLPSRAPTRYTEDSIKGWLVLLGISLVITPLFITYQIFATGEFFSPQIWSLWTTGHIGLGMLISFEIIFNSAALVFSILIVILFYKRRTIAPRVIMIYLIVNFLFFAVDNGLVVFINSDVITEADKNEFYSQVLSSFVRMIIWVPYLIFSVRVKETFIYRKQNEQEEFEPQQTEALISLE
ncbi:DUF3857 domain-containing protein [Gramella sp. GC03-9]|uniref:DUF3857 domain-containing protein n=1 Tax=Christiangramia oceanisediminis TaxID=2920386 RepID=A0A9X2KX83_9FLAO|nr:DUF3857 domain-containing protein [Gramella oceanisediminis]MCP9198526.1 DUF3857 domain-containing protein [Gramella oceanisediminis]